MALDRLERNVVQTSSALRSNKWLQAAKMIHEAVQTKRSALGLSTKGFEDWAGIRQEVESLAVGESQWYISDEAIFQLLSVGD